MYGIVVERGVPGSKSGQDMIFLLTSPFYFFLLFILIEEHTDPVKINEYHEHTEPVIKVTM